MAEVTVSFPRAKTHSEEEAGDVLKAGACPGAASGDAGSSTASTALARRWPHVGARSPQRPGSGSRPPFLSACQPACPACFLPLSFCLFFWFILYFFFSLAVALQGERGAAGSRGDGRRAGGSAHPSAKRWVLTPPPQPPPEKSLPSLPRLFVPPHKGREDGRVSPSSCCALDRLLVLLPGCC